ncbi:MAG: serine/threonine-protein kinase [Myxococcota bacterium]
MSSPRPAPRKKPGLPPGTVVGGRFEIEKRLAAGGMGVVYRALQKPLGRPVALKVLRKPQDPRLDETYSQRFLQEAAAVARLSHPNTVVVHDYGRDGDLLYFAMEFVDGLTLSQKIRDTGPLSPDETVHVAKQMASSLKNAHAEGLVHRDLKPGNIMLLERGDDPLFTKVLDFGLVKLLAGDKDKKLTQSGILMGSPRYMAPEQVKGDGVDSRADVYAFGGLLCFMLTGQPPFNAGSQFEAMRAHVYTPAPRIREIAPDCEISDAFEDLVAKCLEKDPADRFQSMDIVLRALSTLNSESRVSHIGPPPPAAENSQISGSTENTFSTMSSFVTQVFINPGKSRLAHSIRIAAAVIVVVVGAGLGVMLAKPGAEAAVVHETPVPVAPANAPEAPPEPAEGPAGEAAMPEGQSSPVVVQLRANVSSASFFVDDALVGTGAVDLPMQAGQTLVIRAEANGFLPVEHTVDGSHEGAVRFNFETRRRTTGSMRTRMVDTPPAMDEGSTPVATPMDTAMGPAQGGPLRDPWDQ